MAESPDLYVLDTHALYWYWSDPGRLGEGAAGVFRALERQEATGIVSVVVIAEMHYLTAKALRPASVADLLNRVDSAASLRLEPLDRRQMLAFGQVESVPEMHDRLIAAVALMHDAPLVSRDGVLRGHPTLRVIW